MKYRDTVHTKVMDKIYAGSGHVYLRPYPLRVARLFIVGGGEYEGEIEKSINTLGYVSTAGSDLQLIVVRYTGAS